MPNFPQLLYGPNSNFRWDSDWAKVSYLFPIRVYQSGETERLRRSTKAIRQWLLTEYQILRTRNQSPFGRFGWLGPIHIYRTVDEHSAFAHRINSKEAFDLFYLSKAFRRMKQRSKWGLLHFDLQPKSRLPLFELPICYEVRPSFSMIRLGRWKIAITFSAFNSSKKNIFLDSKEMIFPEYWHRRSHSEGQNKCSTLVLAINI